MGACSGTGLCGNREGRRTIGRGKVDGVSAEAATPEEGRWTIGVGEVKEIFAAGGAKPCWEGRSEIGNAGRSV